MSSRSTLLGDPPPHLVPPAAAPPAPARRSWPAAALRAVALAALAPLAIWLAVGRTPDATVQIIGGEPGPDGLVRLVEDQLVSFLVQVERDSYVGIWWEDPKGKLLQLFPNEHDRDHFVVADKPILVPREDYKIRAEFSGGLEKLRVLASTRRWNPIDGAKLGPFQLFEAKDKDRLDQTLDTIRGFRIEAPDQPAPPKEKLAVSEALVSFEVNKK